MTSLSDIMPLSLLGEMLNKKYVRRQNHPWCPYAILNYAETAVFDGVWNDVTLQSRGLIYDTETLEVKARPFRKFFNLGEQHAVKIDSDDLVYVQDKVDGSLGIMYWEPTGAPAIATRGSFESDQALHATDVLHERYADWAVYVRERWPNETFLFEIVYPENRIVVDYEGMDDLVLLGSIDMRSGDYFTPDVCMFEGPKAGSFGTMSFAECVAMEDRPGREGVAVYHFATGDRVKIKQEDYVRLHRIVTGLNARSIWEILKDGGDLKQFISELPDEFHQWAKDVSAELVHQFNDTDREIKSTFNLVNAQLRDSTHLDPAIRKDFASVAVHTGYPWAMFALLDGKDISQKIWADLKPSHTWTPHGNREFTEDTA